MTILYLAIPVALTLVAAALVGFAWAARTGQLDDLTTPAVRVLLDDEPADVRSPGQDPDAGASADESGPT